MLNYISAEYRQLNPLEFDNRAITRAAYLLLGRAKTDELLKASGPKAALLLLGALDYEAAAIRNNPEIPLAEDASPKDIEARKVVAEEIKQWRQLHLNGSQEMQLPYRMRGENQRKAILENRVSIHKNESGTKATITVSLRSLKAVVNAAEESGLCVIEMDMPKEDAEYIKSTIGDANVTLAFQDELAERPENKRAWLGNIAARCEDRARTEGTLPQDELAKIGAAFSGKRVTLTKGAQVEGAQIQEGTGGRSKLLLEVAFPEIAAAIKEDPAKGRGMLTDGSLRLHAATVHGCNGRDFVEAAPEIAQALIDNAAEAAKAWFEGEAHDDLIGDFVKDYAAVALTLRPRFRNKNKLEPARSRLKTPEDIIPAKTETEGTYLLETIKDIRSAGASCPAIAGGEWLNSLADKEIEHTWENEIATAYAEAFEKKFGVKDPTRKSKLIHENFLQIGENGTGLDGGPANLNLETFYLTEEMEEQFEEDKEKVDQEFFDSKDEEARDEVTGAKIMTLDKAEWMENRGTITLELPASGMFLHRLKRYKNTRSGIGTARSRVERFDQEISMPKKINSKWTGKALSLEDLLSPKAVEELLAIRTTGEEWEQREIKELSNVLEEWQSSLRRLDPLGKNPMEAKARAWLDSLAEGKEDAKCTSLEEMHIVFSQTLCNTGIIPFEWDKTPEDLAMPVRSNPLPLKLLCGAGKADLAEVRENPARLWDMMMRWTCAAFLQEESFPARDELRLRALEIALEKGTQQAIVAHAVAMELAEKPETLKAYLQSIGMPTGPGSLPQGLSSLGDLVYPLVGAPNTAMFKGEETSLDDLKAVVSEEGVNLDLTEKEQLEVENAVPNALKEWRKQMGRPLSLLAASEAPTGQNATFALMLEPSEQNPEDKTLDAWDAPIGVLHEELPKSKRDTEIIASAILTHNPKNLSVITGSETISLRKGSAGKWAPEVESPAGSSVAGKVNAVEALLSGTVQPNEDEADALATSGALAHGARISANVKNLAPALQAIPPMVAGRPEISELTTPLALLAYQVQEALRARNVAEDTIKAWKDAEDPSAWGWEEDVTMNPAGAIEYTCHKIMGDTHTKEPEKQRNYFAQKLIGEKEKAEASEILGRDGKRAAAFFLETTIENNMAAIQRAATENMPPLVNALREQLEAIVATSQCEETIQKIADGPVGTLLKDRIQYRILETKIRETARELAKTKGTVRTGKEVSHEQVGRDIIPGRGNTEAVAIEVDESGTRIETNKPWANGWLKSEAGAKNVMKRVNTLNWIKDCGQSARTALGFLAFCRQRSLPVADAIASGKLSQSEERDVKAGLGRFAAALTRLGVKPEHKLRTVAIAASALHQYCGARYVTGNPWQPADEKPLEDIFAGEMERKNMTVSFKSQPDASERVASPFKPVAAFEVDELETERKKMRSANRAVSNIFKPVLV